MTPEGRDLLIARLLADPVPVDVLINNAGSMTAIDVQDNQALHLFDEELALDLTARVLLTTTLLPHLLARPQAAVVNVATGLVHTPFAYIPAYSTAKAGLRAFNPGTTLADSHQPAPGPRSAAAHSRYGPRGELGRPEGAP